jgi:uncharacterized protein (DUF362 family)
MMKRILFFILTVVIATTLSSVALAGPKVAIVKADSNDKKVVTEGYKFDLTFMSHYPDDPTELNMKFARASWTPESADAIEKMVRQAVKLAGGWPVKKGDRVILKPNLVADWWAQLMSKRTSLPILQCTVSDPRVTRAAALLALEAGAKEVMIGEQPAHGDAYATLVSWGYLAVVQELEKKYPGKIKLIDLRAMPYSYYKPTTGGLNQKEYAINDILADPDIVMINLPVMKLHCFNGVTLALKNIGVGALHINEYGSPKLGMPHQKLWEFIVDVCSIVKTDYVIIDAIWAMEGNGPEFGDPLALGMIVAGKDLVAVDWVTTELMGIKGDLIVTTVMAQKYGLGTYKNVEMVGTPIEEARYHFVTVPTAGRVPGVYSHNVGTIDAVDAEDWAYE